MKTVMPRIKREWYDQLIIVDGGSTDGTIDYAKANGYYIFAQKEKGPGAAFNEAMEKVTADIAIIFSPDGNSVPEKIPELIQKMDEGYDLAIVSRYREGAKSYDDDFITSFGNRMFTALINLLFKVSYTDVLVMYRGFKTEAIRNLKINTRTPSWGTLMLLRATKEKLKICEIPGDEPPRIGGKRKMRPLVNGLCELFMIFKEFLK